MPSNSSASGTPAAAGATTCTLTFSLRRATANRRMNEPAASPSDRGNECVRKSTFIRSGIGRVAFPRKILDPRAQLTQLGALRGDELSNETGREKDAADGDAGLDEIHQRPESDAADDAIQNGNYPDDHADDEQSGSEESEQQRRFPGEA